MIPAIFLTDLTNADQALTVFLVSTAMMASTVLLFSAPVMCLTQLGLLTGALITGLLLKSNLLNAAVVAGFAACTARDRKNGVAGKSVSVRVDPGGARYLKKNK